jgi:hypothetical protein
MFNRSSDSARRSSGRKCGNSIPVCTQTYAASFCWHCVEGRLETLEGVLQCQHAWQLLTKLPDTQNTNQSPHLHDTD